MTDRHVPLNNIPQQFLQNEVAALTQEKRKPAVFQKGTEGFRARFFRPDPGAPF